MMGKADQVPSKLAKVKDFMACSHAEAAREHAAASSCVHGASKHAYINKHTMYTVEPHANSPLHTEGFASMRSRFPDTPQHWPATNTRWLYGDNHINNQDVNGSLIFAAGRRHDWSNAGGRPPYPYFYRSKDQIAVQKANHYQTTQACVNENAMAGLNCDVQATFLPNHPRRWKVFPFLGPVLQHEQTSALRAGQAISVYARPSSKQLTIFYAGRINVYNDVPPTQAQNIILKAAACDRLQTEYRSKLDGLLTAEAGGQLRQPNKGTLDAKKSIPSVSCNNESGSLAHAAIPDSLRLGLSIGQSGQSARDTFDINHSPAREQDAPPTVGPAHHCAYHGDEPAVPKALPQARKASLVRFLEKRRERMLSKAPYPVEKSFLI